VIEITETEISKRLKEAYGKTGEIVSPEFPESYKLFNGPSTSAAVLLPFLWKDNQWHLLFIRRTVDQHEHSNQVAFPGGRTDPKDSTPEETALREAFEEIGLRREDVHILGRLWDFLTVTNYRVSPVVGAIPWPYQLKLDTKEVTRVFTIPLGWLADPSNHEIRQRVLPPPFEPLPVIFFHPFDGEVLWGASARITLALVNILTD